MNRRKLLQVLGFCAPIVGKPIFGSFLPGREVGEQNNGQFIVESRFRSSLHPGKVYESFEDFWLDHDLPEEQVSFTNLLKSLGVSGRRVNRYFDSADNSLVFETAYNSKQHYLQHLNLMNSMFALPSKRRGDRIVCQLSSVLQVTDRFV